MKSIIGLLKEKPHEKEVVRGKVISADPFGRIICHTPNGDFRAVGIIKKGGLDKEAILANTYQRQSELTVLQYWKGNKSI